MQYYIEEQTSFLKEDGKYGFNHLIKIYDQGSYSNDAFFFDVFGDDETFNRYKRLKGQLDSAGYICKFIEKRDKREP